MHHELITIDMGPEFEGWSGEIDGKIVCIVPPRVFEQASLQRTLRSLARLQGAYIPECSCQVNARGGTVEAVA